MELKDYTTEELKAELKRRNAEEKAKNASILRCRMCKHWGKISYFGHPINYVVGGNNLPDELLLEDMMDRLDSMKEGIEPIEIESIEYGND